MKKFLISLVAVVLLASCTSKSGDLERMQKAQLYRVEVLMDDNTRLEYYLYAINEDYAIKGISKELAKTGKGYSCSPIRVKNEPFRYEIVIR